MSTIINFYNIIKRIRRFGKKYIPFCFLLLLLFLETMPSQNFCSRLKILYHLILSSSLPWEYLKKHKNVKIEIWLSWSVLLSTKSTLHTSFPKQFLRSFCMLSEFANVLERKIWRVQVTHLHNLQRVHFQVRVGVFNSQQILAKISFVIFDIVVKNKSNVV